MFPNQKIKTKTTQTKRKRSNSILCMHRNPIRNEKLMIDRRLKPNKHLWIGRQSGCSSIDFRGGRRGEDSVPANRILLGYYYNNIRCCFPRQGRGGRGEGRGEGDIHWEKIAAATDAPYSSPPHCLNPTLSWGQRHVCRDASTVTLTLCARIIYPQLAHGGSRVKACRFPLTVCA